MGDEVRDPELQEEFYAVIEDIKTEDMKLSESIPKIESIDSVFGNTTNDDSPLLSLCRLCANPAKDMVDLLTPTEMCMNIIEKIEYCLPVTVKKHDMLPTKACQLCLAKLELFYEFHKNVVEAERQLLMLNEQRSYKHVKKTEDYLQMSCLNGTIQYEPETEDLDTAFGRNIDDIELTIIQPELVKTDTIVKDDKSFSNSNNVDKGSRVGSPSNHLLNSESSRIVTSSDGSLPLQIDRCTSFRADKESTCTSHSEPYFLRSTRDQSKQKKQQSKNVRKQHKETRARSSAKQFRNRRQSIAPKRNSNHPFECTLCKRRFVYRSALRIHKKNACRMLHTEKQYICDYCGKSFFWKSSLRVHIIRFHTGERCCNCELCSKKFARRHDRKRHQKTHGNRIHECLICKKLFATSYGISRHIKTHTGEKPYQCDMCETRFTVKSSLLRHKKTCVRCLSENSRKSLL